MRNSKYRESFSFWNWKTSSPEVSQCLWDWDAALFSLNKRVESLGARRISKEEFLELVVLVERLDETAKKFGDILRNSGALGLNQKQSQKGC